MLYEIFTLDNVIRNAIVYGDSKEVIYMYIEKMAELLEKPVEEVLNSYGYSVPKTELEKSKKLWNIK